MFDLFGAVKGLLKLDSICTDNEAFRLHYKVTMAILISFSIVITSRQYIGDPIDCFSEDVPLSIMDAYCWIYSTYTTTNMHGHILGDDVPYIGVTSDDNLEEFRYHTYYQWVCFVLFFQGVLFYIPRYLWKTWEGGRIEMLTMELTSPLIDEDTKDERKKMIVDYFATNLNTHTFYALRFFVCEVLNFVNAVGQIYFMNFFIGGDLLAYGSKFLEVLIEEGTEFSSDLMNQMFPKATKCTYYSYGISATLENEDGLCLLPQNNMNEKIYLFLSLWFVIVSLVSGLAVINRIVVILGPHFRLYKLRMRSHPASDNQLRIITDKCALGDWFVLYLVGKNIDSLIYREIMEDLAIKLDGHEMV